VSFSCAFLLLVFQAATFYYLSGAGVLLLCLLVTAVPCADFLLPNSNKVLTLEAYPAKPSPPSSAY
jgi:hypothetical protein